VAQAQLEATTYAVGAAVFELVTDVEQAFYEAQAAAQMVELRRHVAEATGVSADLSRRQHAAGNLTDLTLANEQLLHEEARLALAGAEADTFERRERLTALLGLWGDETGWSIAGRLPPLPKDPVPPEGLESLAVRSRLDLAAERRRVGVAASNVELTRFFGLVPEASAGALAEREADHPHWSLGPALEIPVPLFDQSQARLANARAVQRQGEERFAARAVQIRSEVRRAWAALDAAQRRALFMERAVLPLRAQVVEQTQREYNAMQVGVYALLQAKRDQIEAGRAYVESLRDYWTSRIALERALGTRLRAASAAGAPAPPPSQHGDHR
jgi:cobalt-zinc-cadmium efflux system outer membrane protein